MGYYYNHNNFSIYCDEIKRNLAEERTLWFLQSKADLIKRVKRESKKGMGNIFRVFCASRVADNENLWSPYADNDRGFCVKFNSNKLFEGIEVVSRNIQYYEVNSLPKIPLFYMNGEDEKRNEDYVNVIFSLPKKCESEKEIRVVTWAKNGEKRCFSQNAIEEVIFGKNIPSHNREEIESILTQKFPNVKKNILE